MRQLFRACILSYWSFLYSDVSVQIFSVAESPVNVNKFCCRSRFHTSQRLLQLAEIVVGWSLHLHGNKLDGRYTCTLTILQMQCAFASYSAASHPALTVTR